MADKTAEELAWARDGRGHAPDKPIALQVTVGEGILLGVAPTFCGFHPIWASAKHQVDLCNNVDDLIIREDGVLYRIPITADIMPRLQRLIEDMNQHDQITASPWAEHNRRIRGELFYAALKRTKGTKPQSLNLYNPPSVAPALDGPESAADLIIAAWVEESGDTAIPGQ